MKYFTWRAVMGISLVFSALILFAVHYLIFHDLHHIMIYTVHDIAFLPLEVLLVTLILHHFLEKREKRSMLKKMNMMIGTFFNEAGGNFLKSLSQCDPDLNRLSLKLRIEMNWNEKKFQEIIESFSAQDFKISFSLKIVKQLKVQLQQKRNFLLGLLQNPNLLEHESFTDLLWAVFHLLDELANRKTIFNLPLTDKQHLEGDMKRAYNLLVKEWLRYMLHLKQDYPYLYSLAVRTNPFNTGASVIIKGK